MVRFGWEAPVWIMFYCDYTLNRADLCHLILNINLIEQLSADYKIIITAITGTFIARRTNRHKDILILLLSGFSHCSHFWLTFLMTGLLHNDTLTFPLSLYRSSFVLSYITVSSVLHRTVFLRFCRCGIFCCCCVIIHAGKLQVYCSAWDQ